MRLSMIGTRGTIIAALCHDSSLGMYVPIYIRFAIDGATEKSILRELSQRTR